MTNKMLAKKIGEPYATAFFDLACAANNLVSITQDIYTLIEIFTKNPELTDYLSNPCVSKKLKIAFIEKILDANLFSIDEVTERFLLLLIDRQRISMFLIIAEKYLNLTFKQVNLVAVDLSTAFPLNTEQVDKVISQLKLRTGANAIRLISSIDPSLIAGLKVQIGSDVIDCSLSGQLKEFSSKLEIALL